MEYWLYLIFAGAVVVSMAAFMARTKTTYQPALAHDSVLKMLKSLNYRPGEGVCHGFSMMWALSVAAGGLQEQAFYDALHLIKRHHQGMKQKIGAIKQRLAQGVSLQRGDADFIRLMALLDGIQLGQSPELFSHLYGKSLSQAHTSSVYPMIVTQELQQKGGLTQVYLSTFSLSQSEVMLWIETLMQILGKHNIPIILSSDDHSVGFKYLVKTGQWLFIDINALFAAQDEVPYQILNNQGLAKAMFSSLFEEGSNLLFSVQAIGLPKSAVRVDFERLNRAFPVCIDYCRARNANGYNLLSLAVLSGDVDTSKAVLACDNRSREFASTAHKLSPLYLAAESNQAVLVELLLKDRRCNPNLRVDKSGTPPLFIASECGYTDVVDTLLRHPKINIDCPRQRDGMTALQIAAYMGNEEVVPILVAHGADIDAVDKEGQTAMHCASLSSRNVSNEKLFALLLSTNPSLSIRDQQGKTALDIALESANNAAINSILAHVTKANLNYARFISAESMPLLTQWVATHSPQTIVTRHATRHANAPLINI